MNESTARAERFDQPSSSAPYFSWEVAGKPVRVRLRMDLVDRLEREAVESFRSLTSRGSEIGGVLIGKVSPGNPMVVSVEDFELVPCDYARGPLYRLAQPDLDRFDRLLSQPDSNIVGFLRSHTRKGLALDADDLAVFESRFRTAHHIGLLIRPFATKASTAGIFIWEDGTIHSEGSYLEFPFRSAQLAPDKEEPVAEPAPVPAPPKPAARVVPIASRREPVSAPPPEVAPEPEKPAPVSAAPLVVETPPPVEPEKTVIAALAEKPPAAPELRTPAPEPKPAPSTVEDLPVVRETKTPFPAPPSAAATLDEAPAFGVAPDEPGRSPKTMWMAGAGVIAALLAVVLFIYPGVLRHGNQSSGRAAQDSSPLSLRVERTAGELLLTWNRDSEIIRGASRAVLSISDGPQQENIEMDLAQLRTGSIVYSPASADVTFKMEVSGQGSQKATSESVRVLRTRPSPLETPADPANAAKIPQAPGKPATDPAAGPTAAAGPASDAEAGSPDATPVSKTPERPLRPFHAESLGQRLRPSTNSDLPDAPAVSGMSVPSASGLNFNQLTAPAAPAAPSKAAPEPKPAAGGQIQKAELIRRKNPEYPKIARDSGAKGAVEVLAIIGKDGRVKSVKPLRGHPMLVKPAIDAVMQWVYKPTLLNGTPVETQTQIVLNFVNER